MPESKNEVQPVKSPIRIFSSTVSEDIFKQQKLVQSHQIASGAPKPDYIFHELRQPPTLIGGYSSIIENTIPNEKTSRLTKLSSSLNVLIKKSVFNDMLVAGYDEPPISDHDPIKVFSDNSLSIMLNEPLTEDNFMAICKFISDTRKLAGMNYQPQAIADDYLQRLQNYPQDYKAYYIIFDEIKYYQQNILDTANSLVLVDPYSKFLDTIKYNISRFTDLVDTSTLLLEKKSDKDVKYTFSNPVELAGSCVEDFQKQFEVGNLPFIGVSVAKGLALEPFYLDQTIVKNLIDKTIHNAWKYGVLLNDITKSWFHLPIEIRISRDRDTASISVIDHGIGLSKEEVNRFNDSIKNERSSTSVKSGIDGKGEGLAGDRIEARKSGIKVQVSSVGVLLDPVDITKEENYLKRQTIFTIRIPIRSENPNLPNNI